MIQLDASAAVRGIADGLWEAVLREDPATATIFGDERYDDRLPDPGPIGRARRRALHETALAAADRIDPEGLGTEDRVTLGLVRLAAQLAIEHDDRRLDLLRAVDQMDGPQSLLPQLALLQPADTPERLERLEARLEAYGPFMATYRELLHEGIASGLTASRIVTERAIAQLERLAEAPPEASVIATGARVAHEADRERLARLVRDVVTPADHAYLDVLRGSYLAASREEPGLWSAPNGDELYRTLVRAWTTLDLEPREAHDIGLEEIDRISREQRRIARHHGFGDDVAAYRAALLADPANVPATAADLLARAREDIDRALAVAPRFFGRLPAAGCEVREVEAFKQQDSMAAYYLPPADRGARPGLYYVNTHDLPSRQLSRLASVTYHEAVPGHHLQMALELENESLGEFRRHAWYFFGSAYAEGWGLYAERLADEMGLFRDDGERLGMLDAQAFRAARLVVDSGLHALRWPRQRAIEFLVAIGLSGADAAIETDRYISWPGQALTYKMGQRVIERLRQEIAARDGRNFDLRAFHDALLGHGSLPLAILAQELPSWVAVPV